MKKLLISLLLLPALCWATPSGYGTCTKTTSVTTASTQVIVADDVPGGRHYLLVQNIGANPVYCALGTRNEATASNGFLLPAASSTASGGSWLMHSYEGPNGIFYPAPMDDLACIATGGSSTVVSCDF